MTAHKPHKDKTMSQQAAIAQKPTKAHISLRSEPEAFRPTYYKMHEMQETILQLRVEVYKSDITIMSQADTIKQLRKKLLSLK